MIALTNDPISSENILRSVASHQAGAAILFLGTVREFTVGRQTSFLDYEAYPEMAESVMADLRREAIERWRLSEVAIVHRLGRLAIGDTSVAIAVSSPHRKEAFEAGQYLIDQLKLRVPIWKREHWADGSVEWVDPTGATAPSSSAGDRRDD